MGRAERRKMERRNRISDRKNKILVSREDLIKIRKETMHGANEYTVEALMTCFALTYRHLDGYGYRRIAKRLQYIDELMNAINNDEATVEDYKKQLEDETGIVIKCSNK